MPSSRAEAESMARDRLGPDADLDQALEETRGKALYLLVPEPEGIDRWEDVNLKHPGIFRNGARGVVFEKAWKYWTLWRVVRLDTQDQVI